MKHIKTFENLNIPVVGDVAKIKTKLHNVYLSTFFNDNIGLVTKSGNGMIELEFDDVPRIINYFFHDNKYFCNSSDIIGYGKTLKELEMNINSNKYNL